MKLYCICGKLIKKLDLRNAAHKEEAETISYCNQCGMEKLNYTRLLFEVV